MIQIQKNFERNKLFEGIVSKYMNALIGDFINAAVSAHISNIHKSAVNSNLLNGKLSISELELYKYMLLQYHMPIIIKKGIVRSIDIKLPITNMKKGQSEIIIQDVMIVATLCLGDPELYVSEEELFQLREHQLEAHELFKKKYKAIIKFLSLEKLKKFSKTTLSDFKMLINNFHFRIELENGLAIGIFSDKIEFHSESKSDQLVQTINIPGFAVYMDLNSETLISQSELLKNNEFSNNTPEKESKTGLFKNKKKKVNSIDDASPNTIFIKKMKDLKNFKHNFVVSPFDFTATVYNLPDITKLDGFIDTFDVHFNQELIPYLIDISTGISLFMKKFEFIDIHKDSEPEKMWKFVHEAAKRKIKTPYQVFINAIHKIIDRHRYLKLYKKNKKRLPEIIELDHKLDYKTVITFRSIAESLNKKKMDSIINWVETDPLLLINGKINGFSLSLSILSVNLGYISNDFGVKIKLHNPEIIFRNEEEKTQIDAVLSSFKVSFLKSPKNSDQSPISKVEYLIAKSAYNEIKTFTANIIMNTKNNRILSKSVNITAEPVEFYLDIPVILELISKLDLASLNILALSGDTENTDFQMKMDQTSIIWVLDESKMVKVTFDALNTQALNSKSVSLLMTNISILTNDSNDNLKKQDSSDYFNRFILKNLSFDLSYEENAINLVIEPFSFDFGNEEVQLLKPLVENSQKIDPPIPTKLPEIDIKIITIEGHSDFIPGQNICLNNLEIYIKHQLYQKIIFDSFYIERLISFRNFKIIILNTKEIQINMSSIELTLLDIPRLDLSNLPNLMEIANSSTTSKIPDDLKIECMVPILDFNFFGIDFRLSNLEIFNSDKFGFKFESIYSSFIEFSKNSSITGVFSFEKESKYFELLLNFDSLFVDVDPLLEALTVPTKAELKKSGPTTIPLDLNFDIKFKIKSQRFPITVKQGSRIISCGAELSFSALNRTLNIKLRKCFFSLNGATVFSNLAIVLYRAPSSKLTIALNENIIHLSLKILLQLIDLFSTPNVTKFNPVDVISDFDLVVPKINIIIHAQKNNYFGPKLFTIPITDTRIHSHNLQLKYSTTFSIECILSPLQSEQIISQTIFTGKSIISNDLIRSKMSFHDPIDIFLSPHSLNAILNFKKDSEMDSDFLFVNQTGMLVEFYVEGEHFTVINNSGKLNQHYPVDTKIELYFPQINERYHFDISILIREVAYPLLVDGGYVMIQLTTRSLILSSVLCFKNSSFYNLVLEIPDMGKILIERMDTVFISPKFCQVRNVSVAIYSQIEYSKTIQLLDKTQEVEIADKFFIVNFQRDPTTLVSTITFNSPFYFQSFFPEKLYIKLNFNIQFPAYTFELCPVNIFHPSKQKIRFQITSDHLISPSDLEVKTNADFSMLKTLNRNGSPTYFCCQVVKMNGYTIFRLSAQLFLFNQLGLQLGLSQDNLSSKKTKEKVYQPSLFETNKINFSEKSKSCYSNYIRNVKPFIYSSSSTESFMIKIMLLHSGKEGKEAFPINNINSSTFLTLPASSTTDDIMPVSIITKHPYKYPNTAFMFIRPAFFLENKSNLPLFVKLSETVCGIIEPQCYLPIRAIEESMNIEVIFLNTKIDINILESTSFSLLIDEHSSFVVETTVEDSIKYFSFTYEKYRRQSVVINDTKLKYTFYQHGFETFKFSLNPYSSTIFDYPDSRQPLILCLDGLNLKINLECPTKEITVYQYFDESTGTHFNLFYRVEPGKYGSYELRIADSLLYFDTTEYKQIITFKMSTFFCHVISHFNQEICQLTITNSKILHEQMKDDLKLDVSIGGIQLDDMNEGAVFPVVMAGYSSDNNEPFAKFSYKQFSSAVLGFITFQVSPIEMKVDLSFVGDLIEFFTRVITSHEKMDKLIYNQNSLINDDNTKNQTQDDSNLNFLNQKQKYLLQLLQIMPITIKTSFISRTSRKQVSFYKEFEFPHFVHFIPAIESLGLTINFPEATFLNVNNDELMAFILDNLIYSLKSQWLTILGSVALIGSPQKLLQNLSKSFHNLIINKNGNGFLKGTMGELINTPETCLKTISGTVLSLTNDYQLVIHEDEQTASGSLKWGVKSFAAGLNRATTGIITRPIEKSNEGTVGIIKGIGEGVAGAVTNSVGGVLDLGSGILGSIRLGLFGDSVIRRISQPITSLHTIKMKNNDIKSNSLFTDGLSHTSEEIIYWDRNVQIYSNIIHTNSNEIIYIKNIKTIEKTKNIIQLIEIDDKTMIEIKFKNEIMSQEFCDLIETQKERINLIQFLDFIHPKS